MTFNYRAITANCGNDSIGKLASKTIAKTIKQDKADFYVINCQEVNFEKALEHLRASIPKGYSVTLSPERMVTHTKLATQLHDKTGIATFIIHKKDLSLKFCNSQVIRRSPSRLVGGNGYNKGGLMTEVRITKNQNKESIHVQTISGHLDSSNTSKRSEDWHNLHKAMAKNIIDWDKLVEASPHLRVSGYDANTRNQLPSSSSSVAINRWFSSPNSPEMQGLYQAPLANQRFSALSTYKTHKYDITKVADKKRHGETRGGMLDFIDIANGINEPNQSIINTKVLKIPGEDSTARDHDVLISPLQVYNSLSDFDRVKGQMAIRLAKVSPGLAQELFELPETEQSKKQLLHVYQFFLSPEGLLNKALKVHSKKLEIFDTLQKSLINHGTDLKEVRKVLFSMNTTSWFGLLTLDSIEVSAKKLEQNIELTHQLLSSLTGCEGPNNVKERIEIYKKHANLIRTDTYKSENATDEFKNLSIESYYKNLGAFKVKVAAYAFSIPQTQMRDDLYQFSFNIMKHLNTITTKKDLTSQNFKSLLRLNQVLMYCNHALDNLQQGKNINPIVTDLNKLAEKISNKTSLEWQSLGKLLKLFASAVRLVSKKINIAPPDTDSLNHASSRKRLARSINFFASTLTDLAQHSPTKAVYSDSSDDDLAQITRL